GFSLLVATRLRGLLLMLFPQKSPPTLQSTRGRLSMIEMMGKMTKNRIMNLLFTVFFLLKIEASI
ncbi:hypothetical protein ACOMCU_06365, partial [Lysinibacillus sp. UGB7]|uniref:hypothetical protein n=1 Tax=Lysinibacillus sp. UGB7 TaxID=3411039 RepID=UPI003B779045